MNLVRKHTNLEKITDNSKTVKKHFLTNELQYKTILNKIKCACAFRTASPFMRMCQKYIVTAKLIYFMIHLRLQQLFTI